MPWPMRLLSLFVGVFWAIHGLEKFDVTMPYFLAAGTTSVAAMLREMLSTPVPYLASLIQSGLLPYVEYLHWVIAWIELALGVAFVIAGLMPGAVAAWRILPGSPLIGIAMQLFALLGFWGREWPVPYLLVMACHVPLIRWAYYGGWAVLRTALALFWIYLGITGAPVYVLIVGAFLLPGLLTRLATLAGVALVWLHWPVPWADAVWAYYAAYAAHVAVFGRAAGRWFGLDGWLKDRLRYIGRYL